MNTLSVTVSTLDKRALLALSVMFASLADAPQVRQMAEEPAPPLNEELSEKPTVTVDTATVFGGVAAAPAIAPEAAPAAVTEYPTPPAVVAAPPAPVAAPSAPTPPTAVAPVPPVAPPAAPAGVELDKNGLPWDERINTSNRNKTTPGAWKRKPGITDEVYNSVIAELKAIMGAPAAPVNLASPAGVAPAPAVTPPVPAPVAPAAPVTPAALAAPAPPVPPAAPAAPVTPEPAAVQGPTTYMDLLHIVGAHLAVGAAQPITADEVTGVCATHGLPTGLPGLASRPDLIPAVYQGCVAIWSGR